MTPDNPPPIAAKGLAASWRRAGTCDLWRRHSDAVNAELLSRWLQPNPVGKLLKTDLFDETLTNGLVPLLRARARAVFGVDISPPTVTAAMQRTSGLLGAGADVRRLPFRDGAFDIVVSVSTLDHFDAAGEIADALGEIARVLRPGGELLLTLDNLANPAVALRNLIPGRLLHRLGIIPYAIGASCEPRRLRHLIREAGLEVREMTAVMHCPRPAVVVLAGLLQGGAGAVVQERLGRSLMAFEKLSRSPARFLTGHFVAARAVKTAGPEPAGR